ncbi:hypothetical protein BDQ12DRAFT_346785 [Crucibulum laeve]|uniref:Uncharacterized protein n=1 Tax=Crucibulum laeve TaxID=68775 RepID=A0A5C3M9J7_9AGAR|nr:hypothetical protein BDQ12DRAFT_346785 [Crucibulum laeve]
MFKRALPYLVATATGIASGVYIFKPLIQQEVAASVNTPLNSNVIHSERTHVDHESTTTDVETK